MKRGLLRRRLRALILLLILLHLFPHIRDRSDQSAPIGKRPFYIQLVKDGKLQRVIPFSSEGEARSFLKGLGIAHDGRLKGGVKVDISGGSPVLGAMDGRESILFGIPIDINLADAEDLTALPGIGRELARRIVERRTGMGPFCSIEDLKRVKGIGEKKLQRIKGFITVREGACPDP